MLELKGITKDYPAGDGTVHALKGIDLSFRKSEFVSILGPSGCGKTTMLNIIGGLDQYSKGDLLLTAVRQRILTIAIGMHTVIIQSVLCSKVII